MGWIVLSLRLMALRTLAILWKAWLTVQRLMLARPSRPRCLSALTTLRKDDPRGLRGAARSSLKEAGCRVTALDEAIAEEKRRYRRARTEAGRHSDRPRADRPNCSTRPDGTGFADLDINGHRETWPIRAKGFRRWLARRFFEETDGAPNSEALQSALNVIEAKAHFDAPERTVHIRVGGLDGRLYLDLVRRSPGGP